MVGRAMGPSVTFFRTAAGKRWDASAVRKDRLGAGSTDAGWALGGLFVVTGVLKSVAEASGLFEVKALRRK